jgi:hypothetical protein
LTPWTQPKTHIKWSRIQPVLEGLDRDVLIILDSCYSGAVVGSTNPKLAKHKTEIICACGIYETTNVPGESNSIIRNYIEVFKIWTDFTRVLVKELKERSRLGLPFTASSLHLGVTKRIRDETFAEQPKDMEKSPPLTPVQFSVSEDTALPGIILMPLRKDPDEINLPADTDPKSSSNKHSKHNNGTTASELESSDEEDETGIVDAGNLSGSDDLSDPNADNLPSEEEGNSTRKSGITREGNKTAKKGKARIKVAVDIEY